MAALPGFWMSSMCLFREIGLDTENENKRRGCSLGVWLYVSFLSGQSKQASLWKTLPVEYVNIHSTRFHNESPQDSWT